MKFCLSVFALLVLPVSAQTSFLLDLSGRQQHQLLVEAQFQAPAEQPLELQMASASPGRYARHDFAKNIYALKATDAAGKVLPLKRTGPSSWQVSEHQGEVNVSYLLFGNHADGTYNQIDSRHVHLNMPASFLYAPALKDSPVTLRFKELPAQWRVATQLPLSAEGAYQAADLDYFMDSPVEVSAHQLLSFTQRSQGKDYQIELAIHQQGTVAQAEVLLEKIKAVVSQQQAIFGELPAFDHGRYTFIADYLPGVAGDGMEHRNSTILTDASSLAQRNFEQIGTISHEFFHAWNVERIRPHNLQPFDFSTTNMSDALWFAEGFTNYYGKLALIRSGHYNLDTYLEKVADALNRTLQAPGRRWYGPAAVSQQAVFVDAGVSVDKNNFSNNYLSYYTYGEVVALALDLTLRQQYNTDLDALMRLVWLRFGKREQPYQLADLQQALAEVSGDAEFAANFFNSSIYGSALPDFTPLFAALGLELAASRADQAWLGPLKLTAEGDALLVIGPAVHGTPWSMAGVSEGDLLVKLAEVRLRTTDDLATVLKQAKPGEQLELQLRRFDQLQTVVLTVGSDPQLQLKVDAKARNPARKARQAWLGAKPL